ncbi:MAG: hypothetical protein QM758_05290 [Armatimonas sp.]
MVKIQINRSVARSTGKPLGSRGGRCLLGVYSVLVLFLLGALVVSERRASLEGAASLSLLPPPALQQVQTLCSQLVRNGVPLTLATSTDGRIQDGIGQSLWTVSGDAQGQHTYLQYDRARDSLVRFSQSDPLEWSTDREQWSVNDASTAITTGQRYLRLLGWESSDSPWKSQGKPSLVDSTWRLAYRRRSEQVVVRLHRWNGVLLYLSRSKKETR